MQRKCALGNCADELPVQPALKVGAVDDPLEHEADRVAEHVMRSPEPHVALSLSNARLGRACADCAQEESHGEPRDTAQTGVHEVLRSAGRPLGPQARAFFEPRFDRDFGNVRIHDDPAAAASARAVNAFAYTAGHDIAFERGKYAPNTDAGRTLLAHELAHVVQQSGGKAALQRSAVTVAPAEEQPSPGERQPTVAAAAPAPTAPTARTPATQRPETCPPPAGMVCPPAASSPGSVTNTLMFPMDSSTLTTLQQAEIDATAAAWGAAGGSVTVRIDGYASAEGACGYNWSLSCRRAKAVADELASPHDHSAGVPSGRLEFFAHGESDEAGAALAPNRRATISVPLPPPPLRPPPPVCVLPAMLGTARGCGSGTDFTHFDFPAISAGSEAKLALWAAAHPLRGPFRGLVTDTECEAEMDGVLSGLAGSEGHAAFSRFRAGSGATAVHGPGSTLGAMALVSGSFLATVAAVRRAIETQLAAQASSGTLDACALSVIPPATHFSFSDGRALKAVIGGTQGETLFATAFTGSVALRSYTISLRFVICDDFGVDEADLYAPGLFGFWVLQHERSATLYAPFENHLDLPVTLSGTF